jgi:hypothetical protein
VPVDRRLAEINHRYGPDHLVSWSIHRATPMILRAVDQVHSRAARTTCPHHLVQAARQAPAGGAHHRGGVGVPLLSAESECLRHRSDSRSVGEGEAEDHFVSAGLDVTCDQAGNLVGLADGEPGDLLG